MNLKVVRFKYIFDLHPARRNTRPEYTNNTNLKFYKYTGGSNTNTCVKFTLDSSAGFFSQFFFLCNAYIFSKKNNYDFFIEDSKWHYSYKNGWHDYFTTLNKWSETITKYNTIHSFKHCTINNTPDYTIDDYIGCIQEIFKVNNDIQEYATTFINKIKTPYKSLYIRRGDKTSGNIKEMDTLSITDIISKTDIKNEAGSVFVMTDDYTVINELKQQLSNCTLFTTTLEDKNGMNVRKLDSETPDKKKEHMYDLLKSCIILLNGSSCWSDLRSNVGRFHKLHSFDKVQLYPTIAIRSKTDKIQPWYSLIDYNDCIILGCGINREC